MCNLLYLYIMDIMEWVPLQLYVFSRLYCLPPVFRDSAIDRVKAASGLMDGQLFILCDFRVLQPLIFLNLSTPKE